MSRKLAEKEKEKIMNSRCYRQERKGENARFFEKNRNAAKNDDFEFATNFVEFENFARKVAEPGGELVR